MPVEIVHPVPVEEVDGWIRRLSQTFLGDPRGEGATRRVALIGSAWIPERSWGARADGRWVATLATLDRRITVPGAGGSTRDVTIDALTAVTVAPTHRRRGLLGQMLPASLRAARERGDALSGLIAAEFPIYGRYGYAPATVRADWTLRRGRAGATIPGDPTRLRDVEPAELLAVAPGVFDRARRERAGQMDRDEPWWSWRIGSDGQPPLDPLPHNLLVHEGDDGPDGLITWTASRDAPFIPPLGEAQVVDLVTVGPEAYRDCWAYLSGLDGIDDIVLPKRAIDEPARWLLGDQRALVLTQQLDGTWLRILDTAAALSARRYAAPGEVVLDVVDDTVDGFAAGTFRLSADGADEAECAPAPRATADVRIDQRRLASIYLGGHRPAELAWAGGIEELTPGAVARLQAMFATPLAPWNATSF